MYCSPVRKKTRIHLVGPKMFLKILVALTSLLVISQAISYDKYKVYSVIPNNEFQVKMLNNLRQHGYDFWNDNVAVGSDVRIMVAPEKTGEFLTFGNSVGLYPILRISNVQELIDAQLQPAKATERATFGSYSWNRYHDLETIHAWLDELHDLYPDITEIVTIGTSLEGRLIKGIIIDFKSGQREAPLVAMIEGGIHSREWISPATVTWIIKEFLISTDADVRSLAEAFVWHIFPVVNPDGYVYTFIEDRMWRKNRNPVGFTNCTSSGVRDDISRGIDLNRNFDFLWMTTGASQNPCLQTYAGPSPSSELEAQAIMNYVLELKTQGNFLYYFAFHSYSQMILVPFSHVSGSDVLLADNYADIYEISIRGAEKLKAKHGTEYTVGTSADILYEVSGSSFDWVKGVAEVTIVTLFELRDVGRHGFLLPPEEIIPNNEEIMECLLEMDRTARTLGYYTQSGASQVFAKVFLLVIALVLVNL